MKHAHKKHHEHHGKHHNKADGGAADTKTVNSGNPRVVAEAKKGLKSAGHIGGGDTNMMARKRGGKVHHHHHAEGGKAEEHMKHGGHAHKHHEHEHHKHRAHGGKVTGADEHPYSSAMRPTGGAANADTRKAT